uniref:Methenyltetrahydrofolate synthase domain-containing protein n=1 Tax=Oryctolagus cuniculus TaxID=9986 RepID=G1SHN6_RABIT
MPRPRWRGGAGAPALDLRALPRAAEARSPARGSLTPAEPRPGEETAPGTQREPSSARTAEPAVVSCPPGVPTPGRAAAALCLQRTLTWPCAGVSKQDIRERIWDHMESQNLADFPRPVHHRIPNFKGSYVACQNLQDMDVFARAQEVKVDPDKPLEGARLLALQSKKTLLVPTPRLRTGLFNKITPPPGASKADLRRCATSQGVRSHSVPVGLDSKVLVDLVVVGSVAVSEKGWRIGKGEGYADLEYAMMVSMGAVHEGTPVVTIVHDCQVVDIPEALLEDHDIMVDYILTPTRLIATGRERPQPAGITWSKISPEMMEKIPILRSLRRREEQAGKDVALRDVAGSQRAAPPGERQEAPGPSGSGPRFPAAGCHRFCGEPPPRRPRERSQESPPGARADAPAAHLAGATAPRPAPLPRPSLGPAGGLLLAGPEPRRQHREGGTGRAAEGQMTRGWPRWQRRA